VIDLHSHTTASDGQHSPSELFALASAAGVTQLAVTDHDTVGGLAACAEAARARGMQLIPGIELSVQLNRREIHILGHFIDPANARLAAFSQLLRGERETRMRAMVVRMQELGFPITFDDVIQIAGDAHLGRPHLARVLVEKRYCTSTKDAFDRFLADGKAAHVDRFKLSSAEAIEMIRQAGGTATVAHPGVSKVEKFELAELAKQGLVGLEVFHSDHGNNLRDKLKGIAFELDLVPTAGSDFHGELVAPGRNLGSASMKPEALERLKARAG
jgi:predicted metal-dependent phosphoesterase TrpH